MWWTVPCKSKKILMRTESRMDIEDILKMKLETISEEPETMNEESGALVTQPFTSLLSKKAVVKIHLKVKMGKLFATQFKFKETFVLFMTGFGSRGGLNGLPRY